MTYVVKHFSGFGIKKVATSSNSVLFFLSKRVTFAAAKTNWVIMLMFSKKVSSGCCNNKKINTFAVRF